MKKIIVSILLIIVIPYFVVNFFVTDEKISNLRFFYVDNLYVRVLRNKSNKVENVPLEQYVEGVVAGEMPIEFDDEALKAQSVAARTYVLKQMDSNKLKDYDVVDTVVNQVYMDGNELKEKYTEMEIEKIKNIVFSTKGEYLTYDNEIAQALFFSTSVGKTENSEEVFSEAVPYLVSVDSSWDESVSPVFNDVKKYKLCDFLKLLNLNNSYKVDVKVIETTSTGRIRKIKINEREFSGSEVYKKLELRSTFFNIVQNNDEVIINTKGYGHGVGMSQYGALAMARQGKKYNEILEYYYNGTQIKKI